MLEKLVADASEGLGGHVSGGQLLFELELCAREELHEVEGLVAWLTGRTGGR